MNSAEKFEILSAYLDDEASQAERRLVEQWIEHDPLFRQQYQAQLTLKAAMRSLSTHLFDVKIAAESDLADSYPAANQDKSLDDLESDRFSIRTVLSVVQARRRPPLNYAPPGKAHRSENGFKPMNPSYTEIAFKWQDLLVIAMALSVAALTTLSYGSIASSPKNQIPGISGQITDTDTALLKNRQQLVARRRLVQ